MSPWEVTGGLWAATAEERNAVEKDVLSCKQHGVHSHQLHLRVKILNHRKKPARCEEGGTAMQEVALHSKQSKPKQCSPKQAEQVPVGHLTRV